MAKRFYQIAFELGVAPRAFIRQLSSLGLSVGNQMVVVADPLERRIRTLYEAARPAPEPVYEEVAVEASHGHGGAMTQADEVAENSAGLVESEPVAFDDGEVAVQTQPEDGTVESVPTLEASVAPPVAPETKVERPTAPVAPTHGGPSHGEAPRAEPVRAPEPKHVEPARPGHPARAPAAPAHPGASHSTPSHGAPGHGAAGRPGDGGVGAPMRTAASGPASPVAGRPPSRPLINTAGLGYKNMPTSASGKTAAPKSSMDLIPTIDPRAGRLVKEAPKSGVPGVTRPVRPAPGAPGQPPNLNPSLAKPAPAPGARRDGRSRSGGDQPGGEKHGKQTFQLRSRKRSSSRAPEPVAVAPKTFDLTPPVSLKQFSEISGIKVNDVVKTMFLKHKQVVTPNSMLDEDTLVILGVEFDRDIKFVKRESREDVMLREAETVSKSESLVQRPPVVVVMGHVDHGKTSLLDYIRKADVAAHEAGGITQHIGAYQVRLPDDRRITFFDTPGHEAFTEMRRRGAKVTDIVVLVVAADDGVMPQTIEAIDHAKAAEVPITVAITKADKVGFKTEAIDRVKQQLSQHGILVSGWGGDVECYPVAAVGKEAGRGIDQLLEHLGLLAEVEDLKSDPTRPAQGTIIEAENNPGRGVLATLLVQQGTLRRGDAIVAGRVWGRVRAMRDDKGATLEEAPPGSPIEVTGLDEVPEVGKPFFVRADANEAREIADQRRARDRELELAAQAKPASLEGLFSAIEQGKVKALKVILKTDVQGSLEAIRARLDAVGNEEVKVQVIRAGVGAVSESDVTMAAAYSAQILGFHVVADEAARQKAKHLGVEIRMYRIIYELEEEVRAILEGKLSPESRESILGHAEILQIFRSTKLGNIAGCRVRDGLIRRDAAVRLARNGIVVWEGKIGSLRREKDDAREVKEGFECGIRLEGYEDVKEGDVIEAYTVEQVARTLAAS